MKEREKQVYCVTVLCGGSLSGEVDWKLWKRPRKTKKTHSTDYITLSKLNNQFT